MKCESCGNELVGAAIVCRQCNHNNAQGRVSQWRARRTGDLQPASSTRTIAPLSGSSQSAHASNTESPKMRVTDSKPLEPIKPAPIPFEPRIQINHAPQPATSPASQKASPLSSQAAGQPAGDDEQDQPWRAQLKEKVRQARERKTVGANALETEPDEAELDPNPIVESALRRIQWAKHKPAPPPAPRIVSNGRSISQAVPQTAEAAFEPEPLESKTPSPSKPAEAIAESKTEPKPAVRIAPTPANPLLARKDPTPTVPRLETRPLPARQTAIPKKAQTLPQAEARVAIQPLAVPQAKSGTEDDLAESMPRITGEIKTSPQPAPNQPPEKLADKTRPETVSASGRLVTTEVIGLPKTIGALPRTTKDLTTKDLKAAQSRQAKLWVRTLAGACDFEVVAVAFLPLFASYAMLNTSLGTESFTIMFFLLATLTFCYQLLMLAVAGRTTGMACLKLRLVNVAGGDRPISGTQKFARAVAATAAFLCPPLNLIVMQANHQRYSLPDLLSGTTMVEK